MIQQLFAKRAASTPMIYQAESCECGLACIAMVSSFFGRRIDLNTLRRDFLFSNRGVVLKELLTISSKLDLSTRAVRIELEDLSVLSLPAVLHWDTNHYVVLTEVKKDSIRIHDPAVGRRLYGLREAGNHITGIAVEFSPTKSFAKESRSYRTKLRELFTVYPGFWLAVCQLLGLSLLLQLATIGAAFYLQIVIDEGLSKFDADFLLLAAMGFGGLALLSVAMSYARSTIQLYFSNQLGFQMVGNVFSHLMRLPTSFFERRHVGDLVSRFSAIRDIRNIVTENMMTVVLDGALASLSLGVLFYMNSSLAWALLGFVVLASAVKVIALPHMRDLAEQRVVAEAKTSSSLMENMRAIEVIKFYCRELPRLNLWRDTYAEQVNANVSFTRFSISLETVFSLIFSVENILLIYLAAVQVLDGTMSLGLLTAFVAIKSNFTNSIKSFLDKVVQIRFLKLHLERVSDITCTESEFQDFYIPSLKRGVVGRLEARGISYCYPGTNTAVVCDVSLSVKPGEVLVITGPSGSGKSTLVKLLAGLLEPESGELHIDGISIHEIGARMYRDECAGVLQTEQLLSGSLIDNICLFDEDVDSDRLHYAAKQACIDEFIQSLPMGFNSLVGDMGAMMSAGQAQRILLARVFYSQASIVFLDEATANLDIETEEKVLQNLKESGVTIVMVSHRPAALEIADKVYRCKKGRLQESVDRSALIHSN
ncbi:MAG: peptidase domain-containing ABC transporter [Pseudohongiellaceae bacterium]|nr:peptidase domain-containing ABC transporter [Pseudohongiellaceae bacterium]